MKYLLLISCFALSSCNLFYKIAFGIKNPKMESYHSINQYSQSIGIDSSSVVFAKDTSCLSRLANYFAGYQDIIIFTKKHDFLAYKNDTVNCNASVDTVFKRICKIEENFIRTTRKVDYNEFVSLLDDHNRTLEELQDGNFDYIVFADYAKYFDHVNRNHLPGWDKAIKSHHGNCRTKIIYVNLDYLNIWNISKESLPTLNLSGNK